MRLDSVSAEQFKTILGNITAALERGRQFLSQLDSHIGDDDHPFGMANGFCIGFENVSQTPGDSIEEHLKTLGSALTNSTRLSIC